VPVLLVVHIRYQCRASLSATGVPGDVGVLGGYSKRPYPERDEALRVLGPPSQAMARPRRQDVPDSACSRDEALRVVGSLALPTVVAERPALPAFR
jgi:hypothetical protein